MNTKPQIQYLNTDLDLVSSCSLDSFYAEMTAQNLCGDVTHGEDGLWYAMFEDFNADEPGPNLLKLLDALDQRSPTASQVLQQCDKIEFNIGYDCGDEPWSYNQGISHDTLRRIVEHGAALRVTLYPSIHPVHSSWRSTDQTHGFDKRGPVTAKTLDEQKVGPKSPTVRVNF